MKQTVTIGYRIAEQGIIITNLCEPCAEVEIPAQINGKAVIGIGGHAFAAEEGKAVPSAEVAFATVPAEEVGQALRRVSLPDTVEIIGEGAFQGCTALEQVRLPEKVKTLPVRLFSGCAALEQIRLPQVQTIEEYAFYGCSSLKKLILPESVVRIGKYAFYNCRKMEEINIPFGTTDLNMGLFLNCDALQKISFGQCRHISDLIAGLQQELHLTIAFRQADGAEVLCRLLLPDFQYEYVEDTPARQFHQVNYGTGHIFRQCIGNAGIDFQRYDEIFYLTKREDAAETVLLLAMNRLLYPYRLQEKYKQGYLEYIREHFLWATAYYIEKKKDNIIKCFADWGLFTSENITPVIEMARKKQRTALVSFLMDYSHRNFQTAQKKKTFEL